MATAVRNARNALRARASELSKALQKIDVWKKKAKKFDDLKNKKKKKKAKKKRKAKRGRGR